MLPSAPVTFSIMTGCPSIPLIRSASNRATTSVGPPAANGTIMVIGRVGYVCALAMGETTGSAAAPAARWRICLRWGSFMMCPSMTFGDEISRITKTTPICDVRGRGWRRLLAHVFRHRTRPARKLSRDKLPSGRSCTTVEDDPNRPSEPNLFDHVVSDGKELRRQFDTERQPNL